jgi:hypothetical protein
MAVLQSQNGTPSIVDVLLGRFQHVPMTHVTVQQRLYHNYRVHEPSLRAEVATAGRHRNRDIFEADRPKS